MWSSNPISFIMSGKLFVLNPPEKTRMYTFPDGDLTLEGVKAVYISESGNHYLNLESGKKVIVFCHRRMPGDCMAVVIETDRWTYPEELNVEC